ncbi:MAG: hypothetical protein V3R67_08545, partial [Thermodesulfobacteriota bacterium]
ANEKIKDVLPEVIEAGIIAAILRSNTKINSFTYCEGTIEEFQKNIPSGYLLYLRQKWEETKEKAE